MLLCTTTQSTLSLRKRQIQWTELSPVFQDAVLVAHRFKVAYIWIDSLCIIQDSREDWQTDSADMARVYENAYFTVAAVSSANGSMILTCKR
jgi:hypothetical protein